MKRLFIIIILHLTLPMLCMDNSKPNKKRSLQKGIQSPPKRRKKIPPFFLKKLTYPETIDAHVKDKKINYYGGKYYTKSKDNKYEEIINLKEKASITHCTFVEMIKERISEQEPYFLATIFVDEGNTIDEKTGQETQMIGRRYHDAAHLVTWLFGDHCTRKTNKHPLTAQTILAPIHFFKIINLKQQPRYFCSEADLSNNITAVYNYTLIKSKLERPQDLYKLAQIYHYGKGIESDPKQAKKYYKKLINLSYVKAVNSLGDLYLDQEKYEKAQQYYTIATQYNNPEAHLNLIYLFILKKVNEDQDQIIARYLNAIEDPVSIFSYHITFEERWKKIEILADSLNLPIPNFNTLLDDDNSDTEETIPLESESLSNESEDNDSDNETNTEMSSEVAMPYLPEHFEQNQQEDIFEYNLDQPHALPVTLPQVLPYYPNNESTIINNFTQDNNNEWGEVDTLLENLQNKVNDDSDPDIDNVD